MSLFKKLFGSLSEEELKRLFLEIESLITFFNDFQNKYSQISSSNMSALDNQLLDASEELEFFFKKIRLNFNTNQIKPTKGQIKDLLKVKKFYENFKEGQQLGKEKFKEFLGKDNKQSKNESSSNNQEQFNSDNQDTGDFIQLYNGKYKGQYKLYGIQKDVLPHGKGTLNLDNGEKYEGQWEDGIRNGFGSYIFVNGNKYVGEWKDDLQNGQALLPLLMEINTWENGLKVKSIMELIPLLMEINT